MKRKFLNNAEEKEVLSLLFILHDSFQIERRFF